MDDQRAKPSGGFVGVIVLVALVVTGIALFVVTQQHEAAARFRIGEPFPAPCTGGDDAYDCFAIRVENGGDLPGAVHCTVADPADGIATFVKGTRTYDSEPIDPDSEVFVIVQVERGDETGARAEPPDASCVASDSA